MNIHSPAKDEQLAELQRTVEQQYALIGEMDAELETLRDKLKLQ